MTGYLHHDWPGGPEHPGRLTEAQSEMDGLARELQRSVTGTGPTCILHRLSECYERMYDRAGSDADSRDVVADAREAMAKLRDAVAELERAI